MWYPLNNVFTKETFDSNNTGDYSYSNFSGQNNLGGYVGLRNIATGNAVTISNGQPWASQSWDHKFDLGYNLNVNSPSFVSFSNVFNNISRNTLVYTGQVGIRRVQDIGFASGYVIEAGFYISRLTGEVTGNDNAYGIIIQENTGFMDIIKVKNSPYPGFIVNSDTDHEIFIPSSGITNRVVRFRFGREGNTGHFVSDEGYSVLFTGGPRHTGFFGTGGIVCGYLSNFLGGQLTDPVSRIEQDVLYVKNPAYDIAGDFIADTLYPTTECTFTTYPYKPPFAINKFTAAYVKLFGSAGGTTKIIPYYKSNGVFQSGIHTNYTSLSNTGVNKIDLSYIPTTSNGEDEIKFSIIQSSTDGRSPPLAVDDLTICYSKLSNNNLVYCSPEFGPAEGGYPITLSIDPNNKSYIKPPLLTNDVIFYAPLTGVGSLVSNKYEFYESKHGLTGRTSINGVSGNNLAISGFFKDYPKQYKSYSSVNTVLTGIFRINGYDYPPVVNIDYKEAFDSGNGTLIASNNYIIMYPSGSLSGAPTGTGGYSLRYFKHSGALSNDNNFLITPIQYADISGNLKNYVAQDFYGSLGHGIETPYFTTGDFANHSFILVESIVQSANCDLAIGLYSKSGNAYNGNGVIIYPEEKISERVRVRGIYPITTIGDFAVRMYGVNSDGGFTSTNESWFQVADIGIKKCNLDKVVFSGSLTSSTNELLSVFKSGFPLFTNTGYNSSGIIIDAWINPEGFYCHSGGYIYSDNSSVVILSGQGVNANESTTLNLKLEGNGKPIFSWAIRPDTGSSPVTGYISANNRVKPNEWSHLSAGIKYINNKTGLSFISVNGNLSNGSFVVTGSSTFDVINNNTGYKRGSVIVGNNFIGAIEHVRIRSNPNLHNISTFDSYSAPPKFTCENQLQTGDAISLIRFDKGSLLDFASNNFLYVPFSGMNEQYVERSAEGIFGECIGLTVDQGNCSSVLPITYSGNYMTISLYSAVNTDLNADCNIFKIGSSPSLKVNNGVLEYTYSGNVFTGATGLIDDFKFRPINIHHYYNTSNTILYLTGYVGTGVDFYGTLTGSFNPRLNGVLHFGHTQETNDYGDVYIDEFAILSGIRTGHEFSNYTGYKQSPSENVYFNNSGVATGSIKHIGVYDKQVIVPPRSNTQSTGVFSNISVDTNYGTLKVFPPFIYVGNRIVLPDPESSKTITELSEKLCRSKSPFRIGYTTPSDSVNLAFISSAPLSTDNSLSVIDNADVIPENVIGNLRSYTLATGIAYSLAAAGTSDFYVVDSAGSSEIEITSYTMINEDSSVISPLFYKDKLGEDNIFLRVYNSDNTATGSISNIRKSIKLIDQEGISIPMDEFPWYVRASKYNSENLVLPTGIFNVEILTRDSHIEGKTVFALFNGADSTNNYADIPNYKYCVNTRPIFRRTSLYQPQTGETYSIEVINKDMNLNNYSGLSYAFHIHLKSGAWSPAMHSIYKTQEEFIL